MTSSLWLSSASAHNTVIVNGHLMGAGSVSLVPHRPGVEVDSVQLGSSACAVILRANLGQHHCALFWRWCRRSFDHSLSKVFAD